MTLRSDRIVHGLTSAGAQIVRYDRAGKWYIEPTVDGVPRAQVTVAVAAEQSAAGTHYPGKYGGSIFDKRVCEFKEASDE